MPFTGAATGTGTLLGTGFLFCFIGGLYSLHLECALPEAQLWHEASHPEDAQWAVFSGSFLNSQYSWIWGMRWERHVLYNNFICTVLRTFISILYCKYMYAYIIFPIKFENRVRVSVRVFSELLCKVLGSFIHWLRIHLLKLYWALEILINNNRYYFKVPITYS